jgi:outer membrane receptor protein involved in Fe transport
MQHLFNCLLFFLFPLSVFAQKGIIEGRIIDAETGRAVPFANIVIENSSSGTYSDIEGKFSLQVPAGSEVLLKISSIEHVPLSQSVQVEANGSKKMEFKLNSQVRTLGEMMVKSEGKYEKRLEELTVSMEVVRPALIENKNTTTVSQVLSQVPGVNIVDEEPQIRSGSGYSFGAGSRVMVLVDDMPILSGDAGRASWSFVPTETIEQIEVIKGASSVLYGSSALNGAIHVRTTYPGAKPSTRIQTYAGIYDLPANRDWSKAVPPMQAGVSATHLQQFGQFDLVVGMNAQAENGWSGPPSVAASLANGDTLGADPGQYGNRLRTHLNTRYRFKSIPGLSIGLNSTLLFSRSSSGFIYENGAEGFYRFSAGSVTRTVQQQVAVDPYISYVGKRGSSHNLRTRLYHLNNDNDNNQANANQVLFAEYQYQKRFVDSEEQSVWLKDLSLTGGIMLNQVFASSEIFAGNVNQGDNQQTNLAAYAQVENKFFRKRLSAVAGVRLEHFRIGDLEETKPVFRGGLSLKMAEHTFMRASVGQGFRFPTIAERFVETVVGGAFIVPSPNLKPETSISYELGIKQGFRLGKSFNGLIDVAGYWQDYDNYIEFTAGPFSDKIFLAFSSLNIGPVRMYGIDASVATSGKLSPNLTLNILAGYNYSNPITLDPDFVIYPIPGEQGITYNVTSSVTKEDPNERVLKYRFRHTAKLDAEVVWKKWNLGFSYRYNSFMENIDETFLVLDEIIFKTGLKEFREQQRGGTHVMDARIGFSISPQSRLSLIVNNLTNLSYSLRPLFADPPRFFLIQYALRL